MSNDGVFFRASEGIVLVRACAQPENKYQSLPFRASQLHKYPSGNVSNGKAVLFLSTVQGTNKNRQKTTRSLLTVQTALGPTEEGAARPPVWSDV